MKRAMLRLIFPVFLAVCQSTLLPTSLRGELGSIAPHHLVCKTGGSDLIHDSEIFSKIPSMHPDLNHQLVEGHLCLRVRHTLQCKIGFWGGETLETHSETITVQPTECRDAVQDWKDDKLDTTLDLVKQCAWWSTNSIDKDIFEIRQKSVHLDPYNLEFVDPIFLQGRCSLNACSTKYQGMLWITDHIPKIGCPRLQPSKAAVYYQRDITPETTVVKSDYIPSVSLKGACKGFSYCGHNGLVLRTGHFVPVPEPPIIPFSRLMSELKTCSKGIRVISNNMESEILIATLNVEQLFMRDKCYESALKIRSGKNISDYEISFLSPWASGLHPGFVKKGKQLVAGMFEYVDSQSTDVDCFNCTHCTITVLSNNAIIRVDKSVISCNCDQPFNGCSLPNGLRVMGRSLLHPWGDIIDDIRLSIFNLDSDPQYIEHPIINSEQQETILRYHGDQGHAIASNLFDKTADSFESILPSASGFVKYIAWTLIAITVCYCSCRLMLTLLRRIFRRQEKADSDDHLEEYINLRQQKHRDSFIRNRW